MQATRGLAALLGMTLASACGARKLYVGSYGEEEGGSRGASGGTAGGELGVGGQGSEGGLLTFVGNGGSGDGGTTGGFSSTGGRLATFGGSINSSGGSGVGGALGSFTGASGAGGDGPAEECRSYLANSSIAKESVIFNDFQGTSTKGDPKWTGDLILVNGGDSEEQCYWGKFACLSGVLREASSSFNYSAGIGWELARTTENQLPKLISLSGTVEIAFAGSQPGMSVTIWGNDSKFWCYYLSPDEVARGAATIPVDQFGPCWDQPPKTAYAGESVGFISLMVENLDFSAPSSFDMCLIDVEPG